MVKASAKNERCVYRLAGAAFACALVAGAALRANAATTHLDAATRAAILTDQFRTVMHVGDIPPAVMTAAGKARGSDPAFAKLVMADPGKRFQVTDVIVDPALPGYRLIAAYTSGERWLLFYEVGGIAHTFHVAALSLHEGVAHFVWHASLNPKTTGLDDLRKRLRAHDRSVDDSYTKFY